MQLHDQLSCVEKQLPFCEPVMELCLHEVSTLNQSNFSTMTESGQQKTAVRMTIVNHEKHRHD
jgi:hypothetical protein